MPITTPTPDEIAVSASLWKAATGALSATVIAAFAWIWRTDRAVQRILAIEEERVKWRSEIVDWMRRLEHSVEELKNKENYREGFDAGRDSGKKEARS